MQSLAAVEKPHSGRLQPVLSPAPADVVSIVTVGLDASAVDIIRQASVKAHWSFQAEFPEYENVITNPGAAERSQGGGPLVWVIDFDKNEDLAAEAVTSLQVLSQARSASIALSERSQPEVILRAMRAGCSEYLEKPLRSSQLLDAIAKQRARWLASEDLRGSRRGKVVAFIGVRGGAGATTLAVHVATFLAKVHSKKTLIVDHHRHLGHVALSLGLDTPGYSFHEVVNNIERLDNDLLESFVAHHSSGVDVLSSPPSFANDVFDNFSYLERSIRYLAGVYDYAILDCGTGLEDEVLATLACCDELYLIATQEVPALRDLSRYLDRLLAYDIESPKLKVVLNRYSSDRSVTLDQIEKVIGRPIFVRVPNNSVELARSLDMGTPIAPDRKSEFVHQIKKWTASLVPESIAPGEAKRRFAFWS